MLATIIHNGGLVMGLAAVCGCFALIAFWPDKFAKGGGFKVYDQEKENEQDER